MKIVFASTPNQEEEISELVQYIYSNIFPLYFDDEEIKKFEQLNVLRPSIIEYSTLKDAFSVMTSLQTIISMLELSEQEDEYADLFNKNIDNLGKYGLFFPFQYEQFTVAKVVKSSILSVYMKGDNEMLI